MKQRNFVPRLIKRQLNNVINLTHKQILKSKDYLPFYVYNYETIKGQILKLRKYLPANVKVYYSAKVNPSIAILKIMKNFGLGAEIISQGEFLASQKAGFKSKELLFGGSTRSDLELSLAADKGLVVSLESAAEAKRLNKISKILRRGTNVLLRFNPNEKWRHGSSLKDLDKIIKGFSNKFPFLILQGIHEYIQGRVYNTEILLKNLNHFFSIILQLERKFNLKFEVIDIGGGFGSVETKELSVPDFCKGLIPLLKKYGFRKRKIILELGRYFVARSGFYVTRIIEYKRRQDGLVFLINEGLVNNLYVVVPAKISPKYFWPVDDIEIEVIGRGGQAKQLNPTIVCGQMSSLADVIGRNYKSYFLLPAGKPGDLVIIKGVGAYGLTWAHSLVGTRPIAAEFMLFNNKLELIRDKVEPADLLNYQRIPAFLRKKQIL